MLININGQNYSKWEDVPEDIRMKVAANLPDADHNGIPDVFEGNLSSLGDLAANAQATTFTSMSVDGQPISSLGQLPPEMQELLRNTLGIYQPGSVAAPSPAAPGAPGAPAAPGAVPPNTSSPLQPGQVMLNGVPTTVGADAPRKSWWKRLFGG